MEERWEQNTSLKTLICCFLTKCFSICAQLQLLKIKKKKREKKGNNIGLNLLLDLELDLLFSIIFLIPVKELHISSLCINSIKCLISKQVCKQKQD